jgi:DNA-binding response OmpR family regulator
MNVETKTCHILLVDDDPLVIKVYAERMRHQGWRVAIARDGWEACQEARRTKYDMVLLDIRMPFHDGMEVLQEIRGGELNRETPVHILTSLPEGEDIDAALNLGADGVFHKSSTRPDELVVEIERILWHGDDKIAQEAEDLVTAGTDLIRPRGQVQAAQPAPQAAPEPAEANPLEQAYDVFVNPFLGDAKGIAQALGFDPSFQCPNCQGQLCLRVAPNPLGRANDLTGYFYCSQCGTEV